MEVEGKVHRLILTCVKPPDAGLYTARAHNPAGQVSCNSRVRIQRKIRIMFVWSLFSG